MSEPIPTPARAKDLHAVQELLQSVGLPIEGLTDAFPEGYALLRAGETLAGVAGIEVYADVALLRSVAVAPAQRSRGLGRVLVADRLRAARQRKLSCVYLLTTTADDYFQGLGFAKVERATAAAQIQQSREFSSLCPASAVCLALAL